MNIILRNAQLDVCGSFKYSRRFLLLGPCSGSFKAKQNSWPIIKVVCSYSSPKSVFHRTPGLRFPEKSTSRLL